MAYCFDDAKNKIPTMVQEIFSNAVNAKAPLESPAFTGTPTAPTAGNGTNSEQIATTAFIKNVMDTIYPVGTILFLEKTSPKPGFGTWTEVPTAHGDDVLMREGGDSPSTGDQRTFLKVWKRTA